MTMLSFSEATLIKRSTLTPCENQLHMLSCIVFSNPLNFSRDEV